ncbi:tyrosine-type recombinase/integrase [Pseudooceanicola sp. 200-1SW]|uniref:tyrosine-type recombinase/integrase n=1 Tax=Pseudooceanicola sp. 200-1SW TaxID=3425949 RepID=UPI003D7FC012
MTKELADGNARVYHYAFRGGPKFWDSSMSFGPGSDEYAFAYADVLRGAEKRSVGPKRSLTTSVLDQYRRSAHFQKLAPRTRSDYNKYLDSFDAEFGADPIKMFEEPESIGEIREWKNQWAHSPKQYDYATTVVTRLLNWAKEEEGAIAVHHHHRVKRLYGSDRSDIIWLPEELNAMLAVADERERRIIIAASEGGLTPQDIGILTRSHVQKTPMGRRLYFRRTKSAKPTSIPVTPAFASIIDTTPADQKYLIVSLSGRKLQAVRASQIVSDVKARANAMAKKDARRIHVRDELRLYDMRGTAATELLRAGCTLDEIAATMGWGLRHAGNMIEKYAAVSPDTSDEVLRKLMVARTRARQDGHEF